MSAARGVHRISFLYHLLRGFDTAQHARHDYENAFLRSKRDVSELLGKQLDKASILVLGCGYAYPDVALYSSVAGSACGIDIVEAFYRDGVFRMYQANRATRGPSGAFLKALFFNRQYRRYFAQLEALSGITIKHESLDLRRYDGIHMPFENEAFDAVISNAVLEHVSDIGQVTRETQRVTKRGGLAYHLWHNFYSISGSHMPEPVALESPWGHLRGLHAPSCYLNRLKPEAIREAFAQSFSIESLYGIDRKHLKQGVEADFAYEHAELLTDSLREELGAYPDELLLTRSFLIIGRKAG